MKKPKSKTLDVIKYEIIKLFGEKKMNQKQFKATFIANFLSTWTANNMANNISKGLDSELEDMPIEDAMYLANQPYSKLCLFELDEKLSREDSLLTD